MVSTVWLVVRVRCVVARVCAWICCRCLVVVVVVAVARRVMEGFHGLVVLLAGAEVHVRGERVVVTDEVVGVVGVFGPRPLAWSSCVM